MKVKKATIGELGLKPAFIERLHFLSLYKGACAEGQDINSLPISKLIPHLDFEELQKQRGIGLTTIDQFRIKLKELGYTFKTCPFLKQQTKTESREKLQQKLHKRKLSEKEFELIWSVAEECFWFHVHYRYDE